MLGPTWKSCCSKRRPLNKAPGPALQEPRRMQCSTNAPAPRSPLTSTELTQTPSPCGEPWLNARGTSPKWRTKGSSMPPVCAASNSAVVPRCANLAVGTITALKGVFSSLSHNRSRPARARAGFLSASGKERYSSLRRTPPNASMMSEYNSKRKGSAAPTQPSNGGSEQSCNKVVVLFSSKATTPESTSTCPSGSKAPASVSSGIDAFCRNFVTGPPCPGVPVTYTPW
mmetsp:Transcript_51679/g.102748  ORF Transcript_51679/g.102748 Transcript_51679/m.102748 type:complete len:228 (-) Transcript_51679:604-1287(-)